MEMHHAIAYIATKDSWRLVTPDYIHKNTADITHVVVDTFTIADARSLKALAYAKPFADTHRQVVIVASSFTEESQNALLKILEEPPETTRFHIIVPRRDVLLPTVQSRLLHVAESEDTVSDHTVALAFLNLSYADRMAEITKKTKDKDVAWIDAVVSGTMELVQKKADHAHYKTIQKVGALIGGPGASKKMLLEHMALSLPTPYT